MKPDIHPFYRPVVFHDTSANEYFKVGSTIKTEREIEFEGQMYTGKQKTFDNEGSAARFQKRFGHFIGTKRG